ncbi:DNA replication licensing factor [Phytophthora megakarya]|uniref:DNA replication licensing factor n=1 Tax=Phytophthora megakarya TaxID=4795 RepID=A0A225X191_9STRA|nr:DNA replication licensing factor [Phytophthora megakarya]
MGIRDSTRKFLRRLGGRDPKQEEVEQLQPVALAGASKRSTNRSELCTSFAATVTREELEGRRKAVSEGSANWEQCGMCTRNFVAGTSRYKGFCSLDCRSAALYSQSARVYRGRYRNA